MFSFEMRLKTEDKMTVFHQATYIYLPCHARFNMLFTRISHLEVSHLYLSNTSRVEQVL